MDDNITRELIYSKDQSYPKIVFSCPEKSKQSLTIQKSNDGFSFVEIVTQSGVLPKVLEGKYQREVMAEKAIVQYFRNMKPTVAVRREEVHARVDERKKKKKISEAS